MRSFGWRPLGASLGPPLFCIFVLFQSSGEVHGLGSGAALAVNVLALLASFIVSIAAHEAGHVFAARVVGLEVPAVHLGGGPALWRRTVGTTELVLYGAPFSGATQITAASTRWLRTRLWVSYAGGPAVNAALLVMSALLLGGEETMGSIARHPEPAVVFFYVNVLIVLSSLLPIPPRKKRGDRVHSGSDGWHLLLLPFRGRSWLSAFVTAHVVREVQRLMRAGHVDEANALVSAELARTPASFAARLEQTFLLVMTERWAETAARCRALLSETASGRDATEMRWIVVNNLAWMDFMLDDPAYLDEADRMSKEALALAARRPNAHGTRGAVLLALGDLLGAEEHLTFAFTRNGTPNAKALSACCLSLVQSKRGNIRAATSWLNEARALDPKSPLIERAAIALASAVPTIVGMPLKPASAFVGREGQVAQP